MPNWKIRFRFVYLPYIVITAGVTILYTFLHWLLKIKLQWLQYVDEDILEMWLPFALSGLCYIIWLRRRFRIFTFKIAHGDAVFRYLFVLSLSTGLLTALLQTYVVREASRLIHLKESSDIISQDKAKYYRIENYFAYENEARMFFSANTGGRYGQKLFYHCYIAVPLYDNATHSLSHDTASVRIRPENFWENYPDSLLIDHNPPAWFGIHYTQELSNNLLRTDKELKWKEFYRHSLDSFRNQRYESVEYFDRLGNSNEYRQYAEAIRTTKNFERLAKPWVILEPVYTPFANRQTIHLKWIIVGFVLQLVFFWFALYIPKVNAGALNAIPADSRGKKEVPLSELFTPRRGYIATPLLLYLNVVVYMVMLIATGDVLEFETRDLIRWGANDSLKTTTGEWWRLVTSGFIHANMYHLVFNAVGLIVAGVFTEPIVRTGRFVVIYFLSIVAASLTSTWWHQETVSVGASGAIFGLYGLFVALVVTKSIESKSRVPLLVFVIAYIGIQLLMGLLPGIDNAAHIGGLICGFVLGLIASNKNKTFASADLRVR